MVDPMPGCLSKNCEMPNRKIVALKGGIAQKKSNDGAKNKQETSCLFTLDKFNEEAG